MVAGAAIGIVAARHLSWKVLVYVLGAVLLVTVLGMVDENVFRRSRRAHG